MFALSPGTNLITADNKSPSSLRKLVKICTHLMGGGGLLNKNENSNGCHYVDSIVFL